MSGPNTLGCSWPFFCRTCLSQLSKKNTWIEWILTKKHSSYMFIEIKPMHMLMMIYNSTDWIEMTAEELINFSQKLIHWLIGLIFFEKCAMHVDSMRFCSIVDEESIWSAFMRQSTGCWTNCPAHLHQNHRLDHTSLANRCQQLSFSAIVSSTRWTIPRQRKFACNVWSK